MSIVLVLTDILAFVIIAHMLKVRLQRVGRRNEPAFRVVLTDSHNGPKSGKVLEVLGFHHAKTGLTEFKSDRIKHHVAHGAKLSDTVHNMLISEKVITGKKINVLPKKSPIKSESAPEETGAKDATEATPAETVAPAVEEKAPVETPAESVQPEETPKETPAEEEPKA
ncbi:MAG: 30S ribosomal protein S16 [Candidatus Paceibacterota bacterium]